MGPLITNYFKATTIPKAFFINALVISIIATIAVQTSSVMNSFKNGELSEGEKILATWASTFISGIITYTMMYFLFNFGGGMLSSKKIV